MVLRSHPSPPLNPNWGTSGGGEVMTNCWWGNQSPSPLAWPILRTSEIRHWIVYNVRERSKNIFLFVHFILFVIFHPFSFILAIFLVTFTFRRACFFHMVKPESWLIEVLTKMTLLCKIWSSIRRVRTISDIIIFVISYVFLFVRNDYS